MSDTTEPIEAIEPEPDCQFCGDFGLVEGEEAVPCPECGLIAEYPVPVTASEED